MIMAYIEKYKIHYMVAAIVLIVLSVTGYTFDIKRAGSFQIFVYGFFQILALPVSLTLANQVLERFSSLPSSQRGLVAILLGNLFTLFFDALTRSLYIMFLPEVSFVEEPITFFAIPRAFFEEYFEGLKYSTIFWILAEVINFYSKKLTKIIRVEIEGNKNPYKDLSFLKDIPFSKRKELLAIEAQQNYIKVILIGESRTVYYRLKNAINEIPSGLGMQVHRSFWVAFEGIQELKDSSTLKLKNGLEIPVSRSYSRELKSKLNL